jgi:hypothetical protein
MTKPKSVEWVIDSIATIGVEEATNRGGVVDLEDVWPKQQKNAREVIAAAINRLNYLRREFLYSDIPATLQSYQESGGKLSEEAIKELTETAIENLSEAELTLIESEIKQGNRFDVMVSTELSDIETSEEAETRVEEIANKLQAKISSSQSPDISGITGAEISDIIGPNRSNPRVIIVSRYCDATTIENLANSGVKSIPLSPEENLGRLMNIAVKAELERPDMQEGYFDYGKEQAVKMAVVNMANLGYARSPKTSPDQKSVLESGVTVDGQVYVTSKDIKHDDGRFSLIAIEPMVSVTRLATSLRTR